MDDIKEMLMKANSELEAEESLPENQVLKEIIKIEREHFYNKGVSGSRLKEIRKLIADACVGSEG